MMNMPESCKSTAKATVEKRGVFPFFFVILNDPNNREIRNRLGSLRFKGSSVGQNRQFASTL